MDGACPFLNNFRKIVRNYLYFRLENKCSPKTFLIILLIKINSSPLSQYIIEVIEFETQVNQIFSDDCSSYEYLSALHSPCNCTKKQ